MNLQGLLPFFYCIQIRRSYIKTVIFVNETDVKTLAQYLEHVCSKLHEVIVKALFLMTLRPM
jgi:hypothetical protein